MDYGSSFPQSLALLWSVGEWTEVEEGYHHFARMGRELLELVEKKLLKYTQLASAYQGVINEYLKKGYIRVVSLS